MNKTCTECNREFSKPYKYSQKQWKERLFCSQVCAQKNKPHYHTKYVTTYKSWSHMKERCDSKTCHDFKHWGGRGITYDQKWSTFDNFFKDMGEKPKDTTLDRIDVNGNYCKKNCRWTDWKTQQNNRRNNHIIVYRGKKYTISQLANKYGIKPTLLRQRIIRDKLSLEKALCKN